MWCRRLLLVLAVALTAAGCRHGGEPQPPAPDTPTDTSATAPAAHSLCPPLQYNTLTAHFGCAVQSWQLSGQIRIQRDSAIWISVNKLIELGRVLITTDSVKMYLKVNNSYLTASFDDLRQMLGIDLDYATVQSLMVGDIPPAMAPSGATRTIVTEEDSALRRIRSADIRCLQPQPAGTRSSQDQHLHIDYDHFEPLAGSMFATSLRGLAESYNFRQQLALRYDKVELDMPLSMPFAIPRTAKKIR